MRKKMISDKFVLIKYNDSGTFTTISDHSLFKLFLKIIQLFLEIISIYTKCMSLE